MLALKVACEYVFGSPSTSGLTAAIMGVGSVGRAMCELLLAEGAFLVVADIREEPIKKLVHDYPASKGFKIKTVHPGEILRQEVDVLVPTSIGAIIDEALIPHLKCKIILGSANNVLVADGEEDEVKLAALLHHRGILYQVEWVHNLGGILSAVEGYISGDRASASDVKRRIEQIIPAATRKYIELATRRGSFPTAIAYEEIANMLVSRQKNSL
jgi:leucine dehydrogenase